MSTIDTLNTASAVLAFAAIAAALLALLASWADRKVRRARDEALSPDVEPWISAGYRPPHAHPHRSEASDG